jgi:acetyltransferase EpsM
LKLRGESARQIVIIGAGGHGKEVASYVQALREAGADVCVGGFIDDHRTEDHYGLPVLGGVDDLDLRLVGGPSTCIHYISAVGDNAVRARLIQRLEGNAGLIPWTLVHPSAVIGPEVKIGEGTCLAPSVVVTTDVQIGRHCILNTGASVSHDSVLEDFVNLNPRATVCGNVRIGEGCYVGAGATVINGVSVGEWSVIGAGAVVTRDIPPHVTAVGVPARVIKHHCGEP